MSFCRLWDGANGRRRSLLKGRRQPQIVTDATAGITPVVKCPMTPAQPHAWSAKHHRPLKGTIRPVIIPSWTTWPPAPLSNIHPEKRRIEKRSSIRCVCSSKYSVTAYSETGLNPIPRFSGIKIMSKMSQKPFGAYVWKRFRIQGTV